MRGKNKRVIILPLVVIGCMAATAGVVYSGIMAEAQAGPVMVKNTDDTAEKIMKGPVSVSELRPESRNKAGESRNMEMAEAVIATNAPAEQTPEPTEAPGLVAEEETAVCVIEAVDNYEEPVYDEAVVVYEEPVEELAQELAQDLPSAEEMPTPADEFAYRDMQPLGAYTITWYSRDMIGYDAPGASGNGLTPYYSCAMPDYGLLNCTIYVENYGFFHVDDVSPGGICDLYVNSVSEIPSYGQDYQMVYLVG